MPIIGVPVEERDTAGYARLVPGSRVEYRGMLWKVIGMYFASGSSDPIDGQPAASGTRGRTKYLILQSLDLAPENLPYLHALRLS